MARWKTTFFFEGFQQSEGAGGGSAVGWTETWYSTDYNTADDALFNDAVSRYISYRRACLGTGYRIAWVRVSDDANARNTKVRGLGTTFGQAIGDDTQVNCAVLVDFTAFDTQVPPRTHSRRFLIRGITAQMIDGNVIVPTAADFIALQRFCNYLSKITQNPLLPTLLVAPEWFIRYNDPGAPSFPLTTLSPTLAGGSQYILVTFPGSTPTVGAQYIIKHVKFPYNINRRWTDTGIPTLIEGQLTLGRSRKKISGTWDAGSGLVVTLKPLYAPPAQYVVIGLRDRHTGRPSHLTRGRRNPVT